MTNVYKLLTLFQQHEVAQVEWTWYQDYNDDWRCAFERITFADHMVKTIDQIFQQALYEAVWEISEIMFNQGIGRGIFRLDVARRTIRQIADVSDWERDEYDPTLGPYYPTMKALPSELQPVFQL